MRYSTRLERFKLGDYPSVCVRSGRTDGVELRQTRATAGEPTWLLGILFWPLDFLVNRLLRRDVIGLLPYAPGEPDVRVTIDVGSEIVIEEAHPNFVHATKAQQGRL